jgi:hypothetical protein
MILYPTRLEMLEALLSPGANICEIGVFTGSFASELLSLEPKRLFLIDPFQGIVSSGDQDGNNVKHANLPIVYLDMIQHAKSYHNLFVVRGFSWEILPLLPPGVFDCFYIDGDHSYEGVKKDLELCWELVKPGGYVCGHDYETNLQKTKNVYDFGVKRAVDEFCAAKGVSIVAKGMDGQVSFAIKKPL